MKPIKKHNNHIYLFLGCVSLFLLVLLFYGSSIPFVGYNAWNFNTYSLIAHNYSSFGFLQAKLAPVISVARTLPVNPVYYLNHPPLLSILMSVVFQLVGESFFTARIVNILASFFSAVLFFGIGFELKGKRYAMILFIVSSLIPATIIFGRMIGQESLVVFFSLCSLYSVLLFERTKNTIWIICLIISLVLGTFTDWATVYFAISLSVYLFVIRRKFLSWIVLLVSSLTGLSYLLYAYSLVHSFEFLIDGFANRSVGSVTHTSNWIVSWLTTIFVRIIIYFNPVIVTLSIFFIFWYRRFSEKRMYVIVFCLLLFGTIHILLYPEGSFGHPYWTYYMLPFIAISSSIVIEQFFLKHRLAVIICLLLSIFYVISMVHWKNQEVNGNVFRYQLASIASSYFHPYQTIVVSREGLIDPDIFQYSFKIPTQILEAKEDPISIPDAAGFVFSCFSPCVLYEHQISQIVKKYNGERLVGNGLEMWVFTRKKVRHDVITKPISVSVPEGTDSIFSNVYRTIIGLLKAPQL